MDKTKKEKSVIVGYTSYSYSGTVIASQSSFNALFPYYKMSIDTSLQIGNASQGYFLWAAIKQRL